MAEPEQLSDACSVVISNNYDTQGTLTRAKLLPATYAQIKSLFTDGTQWYETQSYLQTQFEMNACGIKRGGFYEWIMSSNKPGLSKLLDKQSRDRGPSFIRPFILGRQKSIVNPDHWAITDGFLSSNYVAGSTGPLTSAQLNEGTGTDRIIRVVSRYDVDLDPKWFNDKHSIYIMNVKSGQAAHGEWKVLASAAAANNSYADVLISSQNASDDSVADLTPEDGIVLVGINNVHDAETFCLNPANYNPNKHVPFWFQTWRKARRVDSMYKEIFAKLMQDNQWFAEFGDIPVAERNRQDEEEYRRQFVHSFLFGRPLNANQTVALWSNLPQITTSVGTNIDPGTSGALMGYRANMVGVYEQLKSCGRVKDLQNQAINIEEFIDFNYELHRARKSNRNAPNANSIDWFCPRIVSEIVEIGFINWMKDRYGDIIRIDIDRGSNEFGFSWTSFRLPRYNIVVNLITEETFDDLAAAFENEDSGDGTMASRGRFLLCLDIGKGGSIYPSVLGSKSKVFKTGELDELAKIDPSFACRLENPELETKLTSETVTAIVECPKNSLWVEGVADSAAVYTGRTSPYTDLY